MEPTERPDAVALLRKAGLRVTAPRVAVLSVLGQQPHVNAEFVARAVRDNIGAISTQAVYDVLRVLTEVGLVRRIQPAGSTARFETRVGDNHHHVVCRSCGAVDDVDCAAGEVPCLTAADAPGFIVDEAEVTFWGTCHQCQTTGSEAASSSEPAATT
nr:Fur family transcriptional regulator [Microlunatus panaciterrae]